MMRTPEEYAADYPGEPEKALAAHLVDLGQQLNFELVDVPEEDEEWSLRIEQYLEVNSRVDKGAGRRRWEFAPRSRGGLTSQPSDPLRS